MPLLAAKVKDYAGAAKVSGSQPIVVVSADDESRLAKALLEVPARAAEVLNHDERIREIGDAIQRVRDVL